MKINHENVYNLAQYEQAIFEAKRKVNAAEQQVTQAKINYQTQVSKQLKVPIENLDFSNVSCLARGIASHVYHIKIQSRYGSPENKCIFCGCDNVDDL